MTTAALAVKSSAARQEVEKDGGKKSRTMVRGQGDLPVGKQRSLLASRERERAPLHS